MTVTRTNSGGLRFEVTHSFGFTMIWDAFKCELKSAHICGRGGIRREKLQNARHAARLMISLSGKEAALPMLRTIARHVVLEVRQ